MKDLRSNASSAVKKLLNSDIQVLILTPGDPVGLTPLIEEAEKQRNIRVVCVATDDSLSSRSCSVSVDPRLNGMLAAELMSRFVPPSSEVAVITGKVATEDNCKKVGGFAEVFARECPDGKLVEVIEGHEQTAETFNKCRWLLKQYSKLAGFYISTANCIPVCEAIQAQNKSGQIRVVATDIFAEAIPYFMNGTLSASIYQNPYRQGRSRCD